MLEESEEQLQEETAKVSEETWPKKIIPEAKGVQFHLNGKYFNIQGPKNIQPEKTIMRYRTKWRQFIMELEKILKLSFQLKDPAIIV